MFLILIALLPFETVNVAPVDFGFDLRPYQWWALFLGLAIVLRVLSKRTPWPLFKLHTLDILLAALPLGALLSGFVNETPGSLRLGSIVTSFYALYLLGRIFFKSEKDVLAALPFFFGGALVSLAFGFLQNIFFVNERASFATMPGRPNGSFDEPDWLGMFLLVVLAALLVLFSHFRKKFQASAESETPFHLSTVLITLALFSSFIVLIMSVSRSAWLGAFMVLVLFLCAIVFPRRSALTEPHWKDGLFFGNVLVILIVIAFFFVQDLGLSRFRLLERAESTASGFQRITLACERGDALPEKIETLDELSALGCRHIDLEAIPTEEAQGKFIQTILRPDPNIEIRKNIYETVGEELRANPVFGIGWGAIGDTLGRDERGAALNASNTLLEIWLGAGLIGLLGFLAWLGYAFVLALRMFEKSGSLGALFFLLALAGMSVFNLFNSGILLGFVWLFFSLAPLFSLSSHHENDRH